MQTLTSTQLSYLQNRGVLSATVNVDPVEGAPFAIDAKNIRELSIDRRAVTGQQIEIGNAYASELVLELENDEGIYSSVTWEGARVTVVLDIGGEPLQAGIFTVDEQPRKFSIMTINALDDMARFNRPYVTDLVFPATLEQILADACSKCNVTQHTLTFDNGDYVVSEKPSGDYTFHQIVNFVAEIAGCNAWIDHLSRLNMTWYGGTPAEIDHSLMYTHNMEEKDITITGVVYKAGEVDYVAGTEDYAIVIEDNPLLQDDYETVITALNSKLNGFTYRPYDIEMFRYPHLWPMDLVALRDGDGNLVNSVVMTHKVALVRGNSRIAAMGKTETVKGYATAAPLTPRQKRILETVAKVAAEKRLSATELATLHLNELMANALGLYHTILEQETGAKLFYMHDRPDLEESVIIWHWTEQGLAWTDQGWNDGAPVWNYGLTAGGNAVLTVLTAHGINADWINAGRIDAQYLRIGPGAEFDEGYNPSDKASLEEVQAARDYAEQKAAEAQLAAEEAARLEIELAEANAQAYADGLLDEEEQLRLQQIEGALEAARAHADQAAADAEAAARAAAVEDALREVDSQYGETQYNVRSTFDFGENALVISRGSSPFQLSLSNEQLSFIDGQAVVAYINGQRMYITEAEILTALKVGQHKLWKHSDGVTTLVGWVG